MSETAASVFVSVVIPVHNGEAFLRDAVGSIRSQDRLPQEILLIDDGSTDGTAAIARAFGDTVRYRYQPQAGQAAARNAGIRLARGDVVAFLDADDLWTTNKLALQLPYLEADPGTGIVRGLTQRIAMQGRSNAWTAIDPEPWAALSLGSTIVRRSVFEQVGYLDETLPFNEDVDWLMRAREARIRSVQHDDLVQLYRRHGANITNDSDGNSSSFLATLKRSLDRRRSL